MPALLLLLILAVILGGLGFGLHVLWWIALVAVVLFLVGALARPSGRGSYWW